MYMRVLIIVLTVFLAWFSSPTTAGAKFYIYDWPPELDDVYPAPGNKLDTVSSYHHGNASHSAEYDVPRAYTCPVLILHFYRFL